MAPNPDLEPDVRAAVQRVSMASASTPGSDRFREELRSEIKNAGAEPSDDLLDVIVASVADGSFSQY